MKLALAVLIFVSLAPDERILLRVNQVGYQPQGPKLAIAFSNRPLPQKFLIVDATKRDVAFEGAARVVAGAWGEFAYHVELDFSAFRQPGRYVLRTGADESPPFDIAENVYTGIPDELLDFMRQQRCGYNPWFDVVCHRFDGRTAYGPLPSGTYLDSTGGWHDAGDQLKYLLTSGNATAQMLLAFQLANAVQRPKNAPHQVWFEDHVNEWGQPGGNGIADVLDEARWGLDWMLKLHPRPDQLYHQVADDRDHVGWRLPQNDSADYGWGGGSYRVTYFADGRPQGLKEFKSESTGIANLAGRYAAAMALGYTIWKDDPTERAYAERLLRAGREVYALGKAKEGVQQGNSYGAPYRYEETTWADDMEWGGAELFRATGERGYLDDAKRYARLAASESWMGREHSNHYQYYPFVNLGHFRLYDLVDATFRSTLAEYYKVGIERCLAAAERHPYGIGVPFIWCSNNLVVALATQCLLYERMTGDTRYRAFASRQRDWLVGRNPWGVSMFTAIPANGASPRHVHLSTIAVLNRPVRGGLVDGPVQRTIFETLKGVTITEPDPLAPFQDDRAVYHDDLSDYSTNEPTLDGTASAVLLWVLDGQR